MTIDYEPANGRCVCEIHRQFEAEHGYTVDEWYAMHPEVTPWHLARCGNCENFRRSLSQARLVRTEARTKPERPATSQQPERETPVFQKQEKTEMSNQSTINITNNVNITQAADSETATSVAWLPRLLFILVALAAVAYGGYWLALGALELLAAIAEGAGDLIGAIATSAIDCAVALWHGIATYAPMGLRYAGYACVGALGIAILARLYDQWLESRADVAVTARPVQPRVLVLVASNQAQAQAAIKQLPESASYEYVEMPAWKETVEVLR